jgi:hypothetical protein
MRKWSWLFAPAIVIALAAAPAMARGKGPGKPSGPTASTIALLPYSELRLGGDVGFATSAAGLAGWEYPMVVVSCYQDVNGDGTVDTDLLGPDIVFSWVDKPGSEFVLGAFSSIWTLRGGGPADCRADLDAYGWKGKQETIRVLDSLNFKAAG